jgi:hypothetical protein
MADKEPEVSTPTDIIGKIDSILASEKATPQPEKQPEQTPPAGEEPSPEGQPEGEPEAQTNKQVEGEDVPPDVAEGVEIPLEQLEAIALEVEVEGLDGKVTEKPTIKELKLGYMRQKDYSKKTEELARQRAESGEKVRQAIEAERKSYVDQLQVLQNVLVETAAPELKDVNWNNLAKNDAFEYVRLRNLADQLVGAVDQVQKKINDVNAKAQAEQKAAHETAVKKAREAIAAKIPQYNDALQQSLVKYGEAAGFKASEIESWADPRALELLHKAYLYDQKKPEAPAAAKKVALASKVVVKPGASSAATQRQQVHQEATKKLQKSGRIEDAAAVIRARLGL